jgi:sugar-specific transcriptional regulator TrmB
MKALTTEAISKEMNLNNEEVIEIMKSLLEKGFVREWMEGIYVPITPIESLNKQITILLSELHKLKDDLIAVLQPRFPEETLIAVNLDKAHFSILVGKLTKKATKNIFISAKELKFIEESDFIDALECNSKLRTKKVKILVTTNADTPELGDFLSRLRKLNESKKVWIKHNPSRNELRYMTAQIGDKLTALLVEADHKNGIIINSDEVAEYLNHNFELYFDAGRPISELLESVKDIKEPENRDEEVKNRWKTKGYI